MNQIIYWSRPLDWKNQTLTPNPDAIYFMAFFNTKERADRDRDAARRWRLDQPATSSTSGRRRSRMPGRLGVDKGKGGKYLILPPGYKEQGARRLHRAAVATPTAATRCCARTCKSHSDADVAKSVAYGKRIKIYPLSQAAESAADRLHRREGRRVRLHHSATTCASSQSLDRIVQSEPWLERDRAMIDQLQIDRHREGQAVQARRQDAGDPRMRPRAKRRPGSKQRYDAGFPPFFEGSHWTLPALPEHGRRPSRRGYAEPDGYPVDARGVTYTYAFIGIKRLGAGQFYLMAIKDKDGDAFDGGKTYRLTVPPNAPVEQYWSVTAYDRADARAHPRHAAREPLIADRRSCRRTPTARSTSISAPRRRPGKESNWVPTDPTREVRADVPPLRAEEGRCSTRRGSCRTSRK